MKPLPPFAATGIGSVPFTDTGETLDRIARLCPALPYWPQMIKNHPGADMILQYAPPLPFLKVDFTRKTVAACEENREEALADFYEKYLARDLDSFALPADSAASFYDFLKMIPTRPGLGPDFLKGQVTGPITAGLSFSDSRGKTVLDDPELAEALVKGLGLQAAWQAERIRELGRIPIIFFDEPSLTGFGSAFSTLSRDTVVSALGEAAELAREGGEILLGIHVCGNTDWEMILSAGLDIINFDAFGYLDHFLLFPQAIRGHIEKGGCLAWGIVPTLAFSGHETSRELAARLTGGINRLARTGLDIEQIKRQSIITPACGLGPLTVPTAAAVLGLTAEVSDILRA